MIWNTFEDVRSRLNLYANPNYEPGSGITDRDELIDGIEELAEKMKGEPHPLIKARAVEFILDNAAIEVNPIDWFGINFCGWLTKDEANRAERRKGIRKPIQVLNKKWLEELEPPEEFNKATQNIDETGAGIFWPDYDHSVPDWDSVIGLGFTGLLKRAKKYYNEKVESGTITPAQEIYYSSVFIAYEAIIRFCNRILECAKKHESEDEKMPIMIECLETITTGIPKTLYQFLMQVYLYHLIQEYIDIIQVRTLGNLDVDGYPFYKKDIDEGRLTKENAEELFRFFF